MKNLTHQRGYTLYELVITIVSIGMFLIGCAVICAGYHFLLKFW
jgi:Tfp pilus assembly protein PilE